MSCYVCLFFAIFVAGRGLIAGSRLLRLAIVFTEKSEGMGS